MKKYLSIFLCYYMATGIYQAKAQCGTSLRLSPECASSVIGHRGFSHIYPENTLLSLEQAFKHGVKYCEVDISLTADSVYVLFHDVRALHRTTNSTGTLNNTTYSQLQTLDAGSWKAEYFKNTRIPTLVEALKLAEKYDAHLYLDTKDYDLKSLKNALEQSGVRPDRFLPSLEGLGQARTFRSALPNTPWVWYLGGALPDPVNDAAFYDSCINLGCAAFEVSWFDADTSSNWKTFTEQVHRVKSAIWAFVVNNDKQAKKLKDLGIDAFETDRPANLARYLCSGTGNEFPDSLTTGNWRFKNSLNNSVGVGSQMRASSYKEAWNHYPVFASQQNLGIKTLGDSTQSVMLLPGQPQNQGLFVYTGFSVDDYGPEDFSYSLVFDFLVPDSSIGKWIALYQTNVNNTDDADLFINPSREIGTIGSYFGNISANTWYRLILTYDGQLQLLNLYLDGTKIGEITTYGNRWSILNSSPSGEKQGFLLFADNDNETSGLVVSSFQIRDYALDAFDAQALGKASISGIPIGNADLLLPQATGAIKDSTLLDYDRQFYSLLFPTGTDLTAVPLNFSVSHGVQTDLSSGSSVDFSKGPVVIHAKSEDGIRTKTWTLCANTFTPTGIREKDYLNVQVYPNPSTGQFHISADRAFQSVRLMDLQGRLVSEKALDSHSFSTELDLSAESTGTYVLELRSNSGYMKPQLIVLAK